jgi:hypothetical protein
VARREFLRRPDIEYDDEFVPGALEKIRGGHRFKVVFRGDVKPLEG